MGAKVQSCDTCACFLLHNPLPRGFPLPISSVSSILGVVVSTDHGMHASWLAGWHGVVVFTHLSLSPSHLFSNTSHDGNDSLSLSFSQREQQ